MSESSHRKLHLGLSVNIARSADVGIVVEQRGDSFAVHTEHGREWYPASELTPAPIPARLLQMAVEVLQELAAQHWSPPGEESGSAVEHGDDSLRDQLAHHNFDAIETKPLGYDQIWVESEPNNGNAE